MAKKHRNKITVNGKGYDYYRKQATYKGQTRRFSADNRGDWEAKVEAWKRQVDSSVLTTDPKMTVSQLADLFLADARPQNGPAPSRNEF